MRHTTESPSGPTQRQMSNRCGSSYRSQLTPRSHCPWCARQLACSSAGASPLAIACKAHARASIAHEPTRHII
eukprot:361082-Chlamydomonas_euryale.AAC.25